MSVWYQREDKKPYQTAGIYLRWRYYTKGCALLTWGRWWKLQSTLKCKFAISL